MALAAAAMAWASARAVCIVENAVEIGTPGAWKHPLTNVPTAWSTTLSGDNEERRPGEDKNRSCERQGLGA